MQHDPQDLAEMDITGTRPEQKEVCAGNVMISYLEYPSSGPCLVLLHATGFNPWIWHPVARRISNRFHIIAPYFCDHRTADPQEGGLAWNEIAADLAAFCRELNISSPFIAGHSMGGAIAIMAEGGQGIGTQGMVLIEPIILPRELYSIRVSVEQHPLASKSIRRRKTWKDKQEALQYLKSKAMFSAFDPEVLDLYLEYGIIPGSDGCVELACHPRMEAALFMGSMAYDPWPLLDHIKCPVLVLEGEKTENKGMIDFKAVAKAIPNGIHREVKGAGHLIPMEQPEYIAHTIAGFFGTLQG